MKQVIVDRGVFYLGMHNITTGEHTEPKWESSKDGGSIVIGHEDEAFQISAVDDVEFILREIAERLDLPLKGRLDLLDSRYESAGWGCSRCGREMFEDVEADVVRDNIRFCPYCGVVIEWRCDEDN